jgi:hypothetical protein
MKKSILIFLTFVLFFWAVPSTRAEEFVLEYETAFTIRDNEPGGPDGNPDAKDETAGDGFWGLITNSTIQYDEFLLEFDISNLGSVNSAEFNFTFSRAFPDIPPGEAIDLKLAIYEADGVASLSDFGAGVFLTSVLISEIEDKVFAVDLTEPVNDLVGSGASYIGIRLYDPIAGFAELAQLTFKDGSLAVSTSESLTICGTIEALLALNLYESDPGEDIPILPSELDFVFTTDSGQGPYVLAATASGTQLNLSLLKAFNFPEELPLHACFYLDFIPGNPPTFSLRVQKVDFTDGLNE